MNATTQEAPSHLQSLQEQRDALEAEIERISAKESEDKCKPLCAELLLLKPQLEAIGAWPCAVIVDFHFGNTWLHANEAHLYFSEQLSCYRQSSSGWGGSSSRWSMPGALGSTNTTDKGGSAYYWNNYFGGERDRHIPNTKEMLNVFKPGDTTECWVFQNQDVGRVFFYEQVICCPMCGFVHRDLKKSAAKIKLGDYGNDWQWPDKQRGDYYKMETLLSSAKAILSGGLFENGLVFKRCERCAGHSFLDKWKALYKQATDESRFRDSEESAKLLTNIESIWPDKFGVKAQVKTSIFRQAKKRARIKPLSRGELAFFSMHLAASQVKELKANNITHDTNKILNQAN
jgi:hypothetical protein